MRCLYPHSKSVSLKTGRMIHYLATKYSDSRGGPTSGKFSDLQQEKGKLYFVIISGLWDLGKLLSH